MIEFFRFRAIEDRYTYALPRACINKPIVEASLILNEGTKKEKRFILFLLATDSLNTKEPITEQLKKKEFKNSIIFPIASRDSCFLGYYDKIKPGSLIEIKIEV